MNLVDILEIDPEAKTVRCEPLVTMGQLTHALDRYRVSMLNFRKVQGQLTQL